MIIVGGEKDTDKKYGKLISKFNSPTIGTLRWNPKKKRKSRKKRR